MRRYVLSLLIVLLLPFSLANANPYGRGEINLTSSMVDYFIKYIRGERGKKPADFYVTLDGADGIFWYCSYGSCEGGSASEDIKVCERKTGKECAKFAKGRSVKWKNGINTGRGKASKFNSKMSDAEIISKLKELGFYK